MSSLYNFYTIEEYAQKIGISKVAVWRRIRTGLIKNAEKRGYQWLVYEEPFGKYETRGKAKK
jgi:predicted site-specific integrase-resolvase